MPLRFGIFIGTYTNFRDTSLCCELRGAQGAEKRDTIDLNRVYAMALSSPSSALAGASRSSLARPTRPDSILLLLSVIIVLALNSAAIFVAAQEGHGRGTTRQWVSSLIAYSHMTHDTLSSVYCTTDVLVCLRWEPLTNLVSMRA